MNKPVVLAATTPEQLAGQMKLIRLILATTPALLFAAVTPPVRSAGPEFYVAPQGADTWSGTRPCNCGQALAVTGVGTGVPPPPPGVHGEVRPVQLLPLRGRTPVARRQVGGGLRFLDLQDLELDDRVGTEEDLVAVVECLQCIGSKQPAIHPGSVRAPMVGDRIALARGLDGQLQHQLALQLGILAQRPIVERVDRTLVLVEHPLDFLAAARGALAIATALLVRTATRTTAATANGRGTAAAALDVAEQTAEFAVEVTPQLVQVGRAIAVRTLRRALIATAAAADIQFITALYFGAL